MITFPFAKINLGLNVIERRSDGYHNLETVFYPVRPLCDVLEVLPMDERFPSVFDCDLKVTNMDIEGDKQHNLVVRAYHQLKKDHPNLPRLHVHLYKHIPTQAGMGGGSADAAAMLLLLNQSFSLKINEDELIKRAAALGADCPFFIIGQPSYAEGIGECLQPVELNLKGYTIGIVRPNIPVSTKEAFSFITPRRPDYCCREIVKQPVETWRDMLKNDFEQSVFALHPEIEHIKERLYQLGAVYAAMSGSGSALFGLFRQPITLREAFPNMFTYSTLL